MPTIPTIDRALLGCVSSEVAAAKRGRGDPDAYVAGVLADVAEAAKADIEALEGGGVSEGDYRVRVQRVAGASMVDSSPIELDYAPYLVDGNGTGVLLNTHTNSGDNAIGTGNQLMRIVGPTIGGIKGQLRFQPGTVEDGLATYDFTFSYLATE